MPTIQECEVRCWICEARYWTHRVLSCNSFMRPPPSPRCPDCGASPRFSNHVEPYQAAELFALLVQGATPASIASEIELEVYEKEPLVDCLDSFREMRNERLSKIRKGFNGKVPEAVRPGTKMFYDDALFASTLKQIEQLVLERISARRRQTLIPETLHSRAHPSELPQNLRV